MPSTTRVLPPLTLLAAAAGVAGCGSHRVARSTTPVTPAPASSTTSSTPAAAASGATGTFTGDDVNTQYGDIEVSVTLDHGRITNVGWLKLPQDRPRSAFISEQASPILRSEVLQAQSAKIDLVSGATFTSDAWARSVASALSRAH